MLVVEVSEVASCIMGGQKVIMRLCEARAEEDSDDLVPVFKVFVNGLARPDLETERFLRQPRRESSSLTWLLFTSPAQPNMDNLPSDAKVKLTVMVSQDLSRPQIVSLWTDRAKERLQDHACFRTEEQEESLRTCLTFTIHHTKLAQVHTGEEDVFSVVAYWTDNNAMRLVCFFQHKNIYFSNSVMIFYKS